MGLLGRETELQGEEICPQCFLSQSFEPLPLLSKLPPSTPVGVDQGMYVCNILLHKTKTKSKWRNEIVKYHLLIKSRKTETMVIVLFFDYLCLTQANYKFRKPSRLTIPPELPERNMRAESTSLTQSASCVLHALAVNNGESCRDEEI